MDKKSYFIEKNLLKLNNGYVLEYIPKQSGFGEEKIIFSSFFKEFDDHYIIQTLRQYINIRRDKNCDDAHPYVQNIRGKNTPNEELCTLCLKSIVNRVNQDAIDEKEFSKKERKINKSVEEYFHEDLYTFLHTPEFNEFLRQKY